MTVTLDIRSEEADLLTRAAKVQGKDLEAYLSDGVRMLLKNDVLSESETRLLEVINKPLDTAARRKRDLLLARGEERALTPSERRQLQELVDAIEMANAERWRAIAALAELRGTTLTELARSLQISVS